MFDLLKQSVYLGMGFASLTRDKLVELGKEISSRAELSQEQTKQFEEELIKKASEARVDLEAAIDQRVDHALTQVGIVTAGISKVSDQARQGLESLIDERLSKTLGALKIARTEDVESLLARVELLEKKLANESHGQ